MNSLIKDRTIRDIVKLYKTEEERKEINDSLIKDQRYQLVIISYYYIMIIIIIEILLDFI